jgi:hypothetical protein
MLAAIRAAVPTSLGALVAVVALVATTLPVEAASARPAVPRASTIVCQGQVVPSSSWNGCVTATAGLNVRLHQIGSGPVTRNDRVFTTLPAGTLVFIDCWVEGFQVNNTIVWDDLVAWQEPGQGFVGQLPSPFLLVATDAFIFTGSDAPVVGHC